MNLKNSIHEFDGAKILKNIRTGLDIALLLNSQFSNEENVFEVKAINNERIDLLNIDNKITKTYPIYFISNGTFFVADQAGLEINKTLQEMSSPYDLAEETVRNYGFSATIISEQSILVTLANALSEWEKSKLIPSDQQIQDLYNFYSRDNIDISEKKLFSKYLSEWTHSIEAEQNAKANVYWRTCLTALYRHAGSLDKALETSSCINMPSEQMIGSDINKAVLCTTRAAALMDYIENNLTLRSELAEVRALLNRANAISGGNEYVMLGYTRLKSLEKKSC